MRLPQVPCAWPGCTGPPFERWNELNAASVPIPAMASPLPSPRAAGLDLLG
jgi:hypothetical protein